jgi:predicted acyl esterase
MYAGSKHKYLRCVTGRHDLPFYYKDSVAMQKSFFDAFLKGQDEAGWSVPGKLAPIELVLREGDPGFNNAEAERSTFSRRFETEWPLKRTRYNRLYLHGSGMLSDTPPVDEAVVSYGAPEYVFHFFWETL